MITSERVEYKGWPNVWRLRNEIIELRVTADVGPRVIHFGFVGGENELFEVPEQEGLRGGDEFRMYGGHRLWVGPETSRTSYPDNQPVRVTQDDNGFEFAAEPETTGLQKTIRLQVSPDRASVRVVHRIQNVGRERQKVTAWSLTVLRPGGRAILPLPPRAPHGPDHLLPVTSLTIWSYTDLTAPCWKLGPEKLELHQDAVHSHGFGMQKIGIINKAGWGAYLRDGHLFVKTTPWTDGNYVDNANFESFANEQFLELETLSPDQTLAPGETCMHLEEWLLTKGDLDSFTRV